MKKINEQGFHIWLIALIVVVLAGLGFTGWYVWDKNQDNSIEQTNSTPTPVPTASVTPTPSVNWLTYSDEYISFQYPDNWLVTRQYDFDDEYGALSINLDAPIDSTVQKADNYPSDDSSSRTLHLRASILICDVDWFSGGGGCAGCGQVLAVENIRVNGVDSYLLLGDAYSSGSGPKPAYAFIVDYAAKVGDESFGANMGHPHGIAIGNYVLSVSADYMNEKEGSLIALENAETFKATEGYVFFKAIAESISVKVAALP
jgi:hypothetical protein